MSTIMKIRKSTDEIRELMEVQKERSVRVCGREQKRQRAVDEKRKPKVGKKIMKNPKTNVDERGMGKNRSEV